MKAAAVGLVMNALMAATAASQPAPVQSAAAGRGLLQQTIRFDDLAPQGMVLQQCWDAIGIDDQERVYIGFTGRRRDGREDFAVFRYDPATVVAACSGRSWRRRIRSAISIPARRSPRATRTWWR